MTNEEILTALQAAQLSGGSDGTVYCFDRYTMPGIIVEMGGTEVKTNEELLALPKSYLITWERDNPIQTPPWAWHQRIGKPWQADMEAWVAVYEKEKTMSLHAPEPWVVSESWDGTWASIEVAGKVIFRCKPKDAHRIVACVNALAGIPACDLPKVRALWDRQQESLRTGNPWAKLCDKSLADLIMPPIPISADLDDKVTRATGDEL